MIVQRRGIEMLCGKQLFHLLPPKREESAAFLPNERCQFIEVIDGLVCGSVLGLSRLARLARLRFADRVELSFDLYLRPSGWELRLPISFFAPIKFSSTPRRRTNVLLTQSLPLIRANAQR